MIKDTTRTHFTEVIAQIKQYGKMATHMRSGKPADIFDNDSVLDLWESYIELEDAHAPDGARSEPVS